MASPFCFLPSARYATTYMATLTTLTQASAERVREALLAHDWRAPSGERIDITISAGVSEFRGNDDLNSAINRADRALYLSKERGRNRVELEAV